MSIFNWKLYSKCYFQKDYSAPQYLSVGKMIAKHPLKMNVVIHVNEMISLDKQTCSKVCLQIMKSEKNWRGFTVTSWPKWQTPFKTVDQKLCTYRSIITRDKPCLVLILPYLALFVIRFCQIKALMMTGGKWLVFPYHALCNYRGVRCLLRLKEMSLNFTRLCFCFLWICDEIWPKSSKSSLWSGFPPL